MFYLIFFLFFINIKYPALSNETRKWNFPTIDLLRLSFSWKLRSIQNGNGTQWIFGVLNSFGRAYWKMHRNFSKLLFDFCLLMRAIRGNTGKKGGGKERKKRASEKQGLERRNMRQQTWSWPTDEQLAHVIFVVHEIFSSYQSFRYGL